METVLAAAIAAVPATVAALSVWRKHGQAMAEIKMTNVTLGRLNGDGPVMEILAELKAWTLRHEGRHDVLDYRTDARQHRTDIRQGRVDVRQDATALRQDLTDVRQGDIDTE